MKKENVNLNEANLNKALLKMLKKYPNAVVSEHDKETGLPILSKKEFGDWEY